MKNRNPEGSSGHIREHTPEIWAELVTYILPIVEQVIADICVRDKSFPLKVVNDLIASRFQSRNGIYSEEAKFLIEEISTILLEHQKGWEYTVFADFCTWAVSGEEGFYWMKD